MCRESVGERGRLGLHTLLIGREASVVRMTIHMDSRYEPSAFENRIFDAWLRTGAFAGDPASSKPSFVIALPPPNITGELHMGHALNGSTQDTLIRMKRMQGFETEWICGTDHASIAVHAVIDRQLRAEGLNRWDLGREKFLERVWEWRERTGATIIQQFKRLGCTLDYDHERFTMDEGYVRAVLTMFVRLYDKGYIYRDNRLNPIHEGTHGIQGLDLLGRKVVQQGGASLGALAARVQETIKRAAASPWTAQAAQLGDALKRVGQSTQQAWSTGDAPEALANAVPYLQAFGHTVLAWLWLDIALALNSDDDFANGKRAAMRYFFAYELPKIDAWLGVVARRDLTCAQAQADWF